MIHAIRQYCLLLVTLCVAVSAAALDAPYHIPVTHDGATNKMVVYNWWSGEHPRPVIVVRAGITVSKIPKK